MSRSTIISDGAKLDDLLKGLIYIYVHHKVVIFYLYLVNFLLDDTLASDQFLFPKNLSPHGFIAYFCPSLNQLL